MNIWITLLRESYYKIKRTWMQGSPAKKVNPHKVLWVGIEEQLRYQVVVDNLINY